MSLPLVELVASALFVLALCIIQRLYLHPLARVPGPKLAALTGWYEAYYDLAHEGVGGQMTFHIRELHKEYGPIIRINPNSVHIDDPNYFSTIYTSKRGFDRPEYLKWRFGSPYALMATSDHQTHKLRRKVQEPFFAKGRIAKLSPMVWDKASKMCRKLSRDYAGQGRSARLDDTFACFVADVTTQYSFNRDYDWLSNDNFESPFLQAIISFKSIVHPATHFPWIARMLVAIPDPVLRFLQPSRAALLNFQNDCRY